MSNSELRVHVKLCLESESGGMIQGKNNGHVDVCRHLSRRVAELECERLAVHVDHGVIRVHGRGHVLVGIAICRVGDDEGGLAHRSVADEHALDLVS